MGDASSLLTIGTAVIQGVQGYKQARAQREESQYLEAQYQTNARIAGMQAEDATRRGDQKALEVRRAGKQLVGKQRASMAAQGLDLAADDALAIQEETAGLTALDSQQVKNNAWQEAWGFRVQAADYENKGRFARITGKNKADATVLTSGLGILNTFASSGKSTPRYQMQS